MSRSPPVEIICWTPLTHWGAQVGVVEIRLRRLLPGLHMRLPVFQAATGEISCAMPLISGEAPGARYSGIFFTTESDRAGFLAALAAELAKAAPELFDREP